MNLNEKRPARIRVQLDRPQKVKIVIYSQRGRVVKEIADELVSAGTFETVWDGGNRYGQMVPAGIYIVYIQTEHFQEKKRIAIVH